MEQAKIKKAVKFVVVARIFEKREGLVGETLGNFRK